MNTINRYNYENYFLLWIDGELPHNQMEEMDQFIANNPDLADELALLQETKLPLDETIFFPHKAGLLKYAAGEISLDNCESYFLLYVDNELSATQQAEVELFVLQHPTLQESFLLLQQIKLTPELVVFNNKEVLYRKEEKSTPVVFMRWTSIAVAAAMIGLVAMLWLLIPQNNLKQPVTFSAANRTISKQADKKSAATSSVGKENSMQKNTVQLLVAQQQNKEQVIKKSAVRGEENKRMNQEVEKAPLTASVDTEKPLNNSANSINNSTANIVQQDNKVNTTRINEEDAQNKLITAQKQAEEEEQAQRGKPEVYKELDTDDENKSLYIGALELNKDKVRGFFRKAGNVFRSKNKSEEDGRNKK
jgi:hypothetical protein